jgi:hypothetical protein
MHYNTQPKNKVHQSRIEIVAKTLKFYFQLNYSDSIKKKHLSLGCVRSTREATRLVAFGCACLKVFLEGRGGGDGLAWIVVIHGIGVAGIGHTSGTAVIENRDKSGQRKKA